MSIINHTWNKYDMPFRTYLDFLSLSWKIIHLSCNEVKYKIKHPINLARIPRVSYQPVLEINIYLGVGSMWKTQVVGSKPTP